MASPTGRSQEAEQYRRLYKTTRWQQLRKTILLRDRYQCQMCGRLVGIRKRDHAIDHKQAHKGNEALFWDADNLQTLCQHCHDSIKARHERSNKPQIGLDGWPIEPDASR